MQNLNDVFYLSNINSKSIKDSITEPYPQKETRKNIINSFVDSIIDPKINPIVKKRDVYDVMSVCLAAEKSICKQKKLINIEYLK